MDESLSKCKSAQKELLLLSGEKRNELLERIEVAITKNGDHILKANAIDLENAEKNGMADAMKDRLRLDEKRLKGIAEGIKEVRELPDYVGEVIEELTPKSGIKIKKIRVPFGVICAIFESRPNVAADIACLCLKSGNACVLKGGSDAINTNKAIVSVMKNAVSDILSPDVITLIESTDRKTTDELITKKEYIDLLIPRGSKRLIDYVVQNAKIPFIETGAGNCHLYVHKAADVKKAVYIAINAKCQRPSVCNAIETILVDDDIKEEFLKALYEEFTSLGVTIYGCEKTREIIDVLPATEEDYYREYNDYKVAVKVVEGEDEAIAHINKYSTKHSEAIITEDEGAKERFFKEIDSACVYANASTRFTDGGEFGYGAEIGISTSKLHARGPMGIREMTTYKFIIEGNGEVRQ
ncbi:MAG: glutamate-5-semialdehyde dehydrogenase [Clostridia bacterium]|nr:glutamate-5-semialdehyde dehydrogenase [Clostridia bacterium]